MSITPSKPAERPPLVTIDQHVGRCLQRVRTQHGLSATTLGRALDVRPEAIARWEDGSVRIPAHYLLELSQLLSCPLTAFFDNFPLGAALQDDNEPSEDRVTAMFNQCSDAKH